MANAAAETWNWMPPLQNIEIRKNFNKLKSGFDAMHFMSRDTVVVSFRIFLSLKILDLRLNLCSFQVAGRELDVGCPTLSAVGRQS